jgi:hypothetical protein
VARHGTLRGAAQALEPGKPNFEDRISELYREKLRDVLAFLNSKTTEFNGLPRTYARKEGFEDSSENAVIQSWRLFGSISRFRTPRNHPDFEDLCRERAKGAAHRKREPVAVGGH